MMYERLQKCHIVISLQEHATLNTTQGRAAEGCFRETNVPRRAEAEYLMLGRGLKIRSNMGKKSVSVSFTSCMPCWLRVNQQDRALPLPKALRNILTQR